MIERIVDWSLSHRLLVLLMVVLLTVFGVRGYAQLSVDAVPDITNVQVQVLTNAPGLSPLEVEQLVTRPIELSMAGLPGAQTMRSTSRSAVSAVTIVFKDDVDLAYARELVSQRLSAARDAIPSSAKRPVLGPMTTGLGEIYHFTLAWPGHSSRDLRTLFDWEIAYALRSVEGVVEVNGWGGQTKQVEVRLRPSDMLSLGITQEEVEASLLGGGQNAGGGALERREDQVLVRFDGQYRTVAQIGAQVVKAGASGVPVLVRDVATVREGDAFRSAVATADGEGETVYAMVQMVAGGNAHQTVPRVEARIAEIRQRLPEGVRIEPFYVRTALVDRVLGTVKRSLLEGGVIVIVVLLLFLGNARASLVVATAIPLAMLGAFACMNALGMSGNLMSLGAVDFGLVVDGAVVVVEGTLTVMAVRTLTARDALIQESKSFGAIAFGVMIIGLVYVPVLLLEGTEGKMFRPMVWTVLFALGTAFVLSFTWIPVATAVLVKHASTQDSFFVRLIRRAYEPLLAVFMKRPLGSAGLSVILFGASMVFAFGRGAEFVPRLEEGDLVVQVTRPPNVSLSEAALGTEAVERALRTFPEVRRVVSRTGSPDVATDIMGVEQSDVFVLLNPKSTWQTATTRESLIAAFEKALRKSLPGTLFSFTQPIEMRSQELLGGIRTDLGIKVFGDDLPTLVRLAHEVELVVSGVPGAADVRVEPVSGLTMVTVLPDAMGMARSSVKPESLRIAIEALRTGRTVGTMAVGERRFDVVVRLDAPPKPDLRGLEDTLLPLAGGRSVPLGNLAQMHWDDGPAQVSREQARRRVMVESNVRGRDLASFVGDVHKRLDAIPRPPGYYFVLAGQYENLARAATRLAIIVPLTLAAVFLMLYFAFRRALPAALIFLNVPVAASGGIVALALRGMPFSISAAVGFIALFGVATMNGVVLLSAAQSFEEEGLDPKEAAFAAAHERLRPVFTTAVVASLGFLPMALASGTGAEVQRPLATVVMGGLVTATLLTLCVLPSLYALLRRRGTQASERRRN